MQSVETFHKDFSVETTFIFLSAQSVARATEKNQKLHNPLFFINIKIWNIFCIKI